MNLEDKLLRAKHYYDGIQLDFDGFEERVFGGITQATRSRGILNSRLNRILIGIISPIACLGIFIWVAPTASANTLLSIEQISSKVFLLNYTHPINGYVVIDGKKLTSAQYEMLFSKAVWTKNGYDVTMVPHVNVEVQQGQSEEYQTLQQAMKAADVHVEAPIFIPEYVQKIHYYANIGSSVSIWYQYSDNRQIYLTVFSSPIGTERLDNVHQVRIDNGWATVGETPQLYSGKGGTIQASANYVLDYVDGHGVQYRIAGSGFSAEDLINMMKSISNP